MRLSGQILLLCLLLTGQAIVPGAVSAAPLGFCGHQLRTGFEEIDSASFDEIRMERDLFQLRNYGVSCEDIASAATGELELTFHEDIDGLVLWTVAFITTTPNDQIFFDAIAAIRQRLGRNEDRFFDGDADADLNVTGIQKVKFAAWQALPVTVGEDVSVYKAIVVLDERDPRGQTITALLSLDGTLTGGGDR